MTPHIIRVGVDAWNLLGDRRGIGRYLRTILAEWHAHFRDRVDVALIVPEYPAWISARRYRAQVNNVPYRVFSRRWHRHVRDLDVLWFPFNGCSWLNFSLPAVATLHDASNFVVAGYQPEAQAVFRNAAARCQYLITDSQFSQLELARELSIAHHRLIPVPLGVSPPPAVIPIPHVFAGLGRYVLFVGTSDRRKGLDVLTAAMMHVQARHPDIALVLVGEASDAVLHLDRIRAHVLGYVDDTTLHALYRGAAIFAFPSRYEGFGLPPLEAMAHGVPVVTTTSSALPEAVGDAALSVPVDDPHALADAMLRIIDNEMLAATLRERGLARAASMTWRKTAEATLNVLEYAVRGA